MKDRPTCATCAAFSREVKGLTPYVVRQCRLRAPDSGGWPTVREDDWCLDHTPTDDETR